ncbi:MAG: tyrosine-type recombinase/integrase [Gammaproteobacteria bacterium]
MLTPSAVQNAKPQAKQYKLHDERGLFLLVTPAGGKLWRFKYRRPVTKRENLLALGAFPDVKLQKARERRDKARALLAEGIDPSEQHKAETAAKLERMENTFSAVADELLRQRAARLAPGTAVRERRLLESDLAPYLRDRPIADVTAPDLLVALRKIEGRGAVETAHRARMLAGQVFKYASATGRVPTNYNPATDLVGALPQPKGRNFATVYDPKKGRDDLGKVAELLRALHGYQGGPVVQAALKLAPLVFARPGELRKARWADIDLDAAEWRYIASKTKQPHIVPLASQAVAILRDLRPLTGRGEYVFPSGRGRGKPMSENAVTAALRYLGFDGQTMTGHGFRALARTVLDEVLGFRPDYIEHQLAHAVRDANGTAYNRTAHLPERRKMMQAWADYLDALRMGANVIPIKRSA